jgi:Carboxypeptidase regulatory-like domain
MRAERNTMRVANRALSAPSPKRSLQLIGAFSLLAFLLLPGWAQQSELRTVRGAVLDKAENPVASAVVYLKNVRTLAVKTYISDRSGEYRFSGLDPNVDYEVHAESESMTSNTRTVSSFDSRKDIVISLKLDREKKKT